MNKLPDSQQLRLERLAGHLCTEIYVLKAWGAWRSVYADRAERQKRNAEIAGKHAAVRAIYRRIRRHA